MNTKDNSTNVTELNISCLSRPSTWHDRLRCRLFPAQHCDYPEAPSDYKDVLVTRVTVNLSLPDRLRAALTGRIKVDTRTVTENEIGHHVTKSTAYVLPPATWDT